MINRIIRVNVCETLNENLKQSHILYKLLVLKSVLSEEDVSW